MEITRLSTKARSSCRRTTYFPRLGAGHEIHHRGDRDGILLGPAVRFPKTDLEQVVGCLRPKHKPKNACTDACCHWTRGDPAS